MVCLAGFYSVRTAICIPWQSHHHQIRPTTAKSLLLLLRVRLLEHSHRVRLCTTLTDDDTFTQSVDERETESTRPPVRNFNPLVNYLFYTIAVLAAYVLYYSFGFPAVIAMMLFFVIRLIRDTARVVKTYEYRFARQAAVVNLVYSMTFFTILVVNGLAISQTGVPVFLPDFQDLTSWTPIFIMGGVFGMSNIKRMWGPLPSF